MKHILKIGLLFSMYCLFSCNNKEMQEKQEEASLSIKSLILSQEQNLNAEQLQERRKIIRIIYEHVKIDTVANHFYLLKNGEDMEKKGVPKDIVTELQGNIKDINVFIDSTGLGKEVFISWEENKKEFMNSDKRETTLFK